ncbi:MAG TPA: gamma-glutamyltransferase, partial [Allosphingosinicella sp.]
MLKHLLLPAALLLASCASAPASQQSAPATGPATASRGMVSAADPRAAQAGREILDMGGSAADAALATLLALTVVEPQSSGIGGGG